MSSAGAAPSVRQNEKSLLRARRFDCTREIMPPVIGINGALKAALIAFLLFMDLVVV